MPDRYFTYRRIFNITFSAVIFFLAMFFAFSYARRGNVTVRQLDPIGINQNIANIPHPIPAVNHETKQSSAYQAVPILMYHYIREVDPAKDYLGYRLSVTPSAFDQQVNWLSNHGYQAVRLDDYCQSKISVTKKPVILTFDDGYEDAFTSALPILQKYHFTGTFFIIKSRINQPEYLSNTQIKTMVSEGMEMGSHTVNHINLSTASADKQMFELNQSKQYSQVLAYPSGKYSPITVQLANKAGYDCAVTTNPGIASSLSPLYELPRVRISGGESLSNFIEGVTNTKGFH